MAAWGDIVVSDRTTFSLIVRVTVVPAASITTLVNVGASLSNVS